MTTKDVKQNAKASLMDELKSIKGVLNTDDDNVPLLLDDDDVPVLTTPDDDLSANQASLDDAIRQLESMELSPRSHRAPPPDKSISIEDKIRGNAAPPLFKDEATTVRENPFLKKPADRFSESRKQAEAALQSVISHSKASPVKSAALEEKAAPMTVKDHPSDGPVEFTDNQFLKSSSAAPTSTPNKKMQALAPQEEKDGSDAILKLLEEESEIDLDLDDDFGDLVDIDVDAMIAEQQPTKHAPAKQTMPPSRPNVKPASPTASRPTDAALDDIVDEVVEEYMVILEAALKKKLKEKLPDLLKK